MKNKSFLSISATLLLIASCSKGAVKVPTVVNVNLFDLSAGLSIHTEEQKALINADNPGEFIDSHESEFGNNSLSKPLPITFSWNETNDINQKASKYRLSISENSELYNASTYETKAMEIDVYNLKINTRYYYQVSSNHHGKYFDSNVADFIIEDSAPRNICVDGVENVRDLGGWDIGNSKTFKQGMIYRTAQFNKNGYGTPYNSVITKAGKKTLIEELGIKTDIDLRRTDDFDGTDEVNSITSSPLGKTVNYVSAPMYYGNRNIFNDSSNYPSIVTFFDTLASANNYPVAFHCVRGTDRTGALAYVLGALVGMSKEDLMLDYLFSDLANIGNPVFESTITADGFYVKGIDNSEGTTLSQKTKNYLINNVGVTEATLNSVIDILTE